MTTPTISDKAVLEKKKNDELIGIANSLGLSPSPRSKKAELVELIVSTVVVSQPVGSPSSDQGSTSQSPQEQANRPARPRAGMASRRAPVAELSDGDLFSSTEPKQEKASTTSVVGDSEDSVDQSRNARLIRSKRPANAVVETAPVWNDDLVKTTVSPLVKFEPVAILPPIVVELDPATAPSRNHNRTNSNPQQPRRRGNDNRTSGQDRSANEGDSESNSPLEEVVLGEVAPRESQRESNGRESFAREGFSRDNQSRDNQSRDNQSRDNQSRDNQSRDNQSRDNQSRDNQSRDNQNRNDGQRNDSNRSMDSDRGGDRDIDANSTRRREKRRNGRTNPRQEGRDGETRGSVDASNAELTDFSGLLDLRDEGFGFIRANGYLPSPKDVYVSVNLVRKYSLRRGDMLEGGARSAIGSEKYPALVRLDTVNRLDPDEAKLRAKFEELTPLFPDDRLKLESSIDPLNVTARIIDLIAPIGKGQRGLIVSPPKAGKTTIMKEIAHCIEANNPDVYLMVLLVDERPEEVTDMRRSVRGEVVSSTFDRPSEEHVAVVELAIEKAKRMVEMKRDVVIILDGITRLTRAYNLALPATGRIMSGGVDSGAIYPPKKFFGAARNVEEGGSLTILATALVETGSRMDEVIFEEFKGTGNMELRLDRRLAERRIYPAIDVISSSTRHEELLFQRDQLNQVWKLRRVLNALSSEGSSAPGLELLIDKIKQTKSNNDFLAEIAKSPGA
ncbi:MULTISPECIES: transcription termination factor Rho [Acidithrix]|uniref:Transcription termination factor Rho n=1 Tax=Acidithrix ferrooxidans TaxID=1280514 RepID=A0A0D8HJC0_9ACTN|nr:MULTISPECIES: transcription termination factor Rho [Acidithrix]KJF18033.1 hypothetical protein AXFE_11310 [Acidithrix ferrooxidans]